MILFFSLYKSALDLTFYWVKLLKKFYIFQGGAFDVCKLKGGAQRIKNKDITVYRLFKL